MIHPYRAGVIRIEVATLLGSLGASLKAEANRFSRWVFQAIDAAPKESKHLYLIAMKEVPDIATVYDQLVSGGRRQESISGIRSRNFTESTRCVGVCRFTCGHPTTHCTDSTPHFHPLSIYAEDSISGIL